MCTAHQFAVQQQELLLPVTSITHVASSLIGAFPVSMQALPMLVAEGNMQGMELLAQQVRWVCCAAALLCQNLLQLALWRAAFGRL